MKQQIFNSLTDNFTKFLKAHILVESRIKVHKEEAIFSILFAKYLLSTHHVTDVEIDISNNKRLSSRLHAIRE